MIWLISFTFEHSYTDLPQPILENGANQKKCPIWPAPQNGAKISEDFRVKNDPEKKLIQISVGQEDFTSKQCIWAFEIIFFVE